MNFNLIKKVLRDYKFSILLFGFGTAAYGASMVAIFPSIQTSANDLMSYMDKMPSAFREAFGMSINSFSTLEGYLSMEYFSMIWIFILVAFTIAFASQAIAGEIDKGTMETLLSQPISRTKIILSKSLVWIFLILLIISGTFIGVFVTAIIANIKVEYLGFLIFGGVALTFFWSFYGLGMFFSSVFYDRSKAIFAPLAIFLAMYLLDILSKLYDQVDKFHFLSLLKYYGNPVEVIQKKVVPWNEVEVLLTVGLVFFFLSIVIFRKKDIY
ncbi:MAG: ABC transporter permease [Patescibacteria group bacterium]|nr:ABC transporter permease [Patescibacteria group bacterium]